MRIGIDVGGTHTDAVILAGDEVISAKKVLTSADVMGGVKEALAAVLLGASDDADVELVMIGTTQFTNAIVERRELAPTAVIRIGLPAGRGLTPMIDWPEDLADAIGRNHYLVAGGYLYDGRELAALDDQAVDSAIADIARKKITSVAIASAFSPMQPGPEKIVAKRLSAALPDVRITLSHPFGRLGLIERENAAILNATLLPFADRVVDSFVQAVRERGLRCPVFISQNDGTLMNAKFVKSFPALTFASGPTNSLRGACKLSGLDEAIVVDIGGTTSDVGVLHKGFPRESNVIVEVGGVRTNFRMPDILPIGLGGGSMVLDKGATIGPRSVGHRLVEEGLVFGGQTLTTTDILVASGGARIGDPSRVSTLDSRVVETAQQTLHTMLDRAIETMKPSASDMPVILVGGGAILVTRGLAASNQLHRPEHADVANAIGAAIAQIGGESERLVSYREQPRDDALRAVTDDATSRAVAAGADPETVRTVDIEETSIPYMAEGATRLRVKVIGDIRAHS